MKAISTKAIAMPKIAFPRVTDVTVTGRTGVALLCAAATLVEFFSRLRIAVTDFFCNFAVPKYLNYMFPLSIRLNARTYPGYFFIALLTYNSSTAILSVNYLLIEEKFRCFGERDKIAVSLSLIVKTSEQ